MLLVQVVSSFENSRDVVSHIKFSNTFSNITNILVVFYITIIEI